jgi:hypothetical protein
MDLTQLVCRFIRDLKSSSKSKRDAKVEVNPSEKAKEILGDSDAQSAPRDGMSAGSARFLIGQCADYKIQSLEDKGRYFQALILDHKGKVFNELLVDKLNGNIRFTR